ncbi:diguanylate cyclase (GGDEF)-like protein [Paenibacillus cellulosilyticus]|uniref:Diguanylate cyclase (GGDEF)-like protein n=1 Tax=Paenibacillus cellulosilyticus TaxID=375489 RepID=A0A2V2YZ42_9BACL|nr:EAL domain-containing protein [Paenibacillus cellulosilyticus]PWV98604.1 diguanylate cyclase (GGDEF)-like protein [Paenibacillus cellulosilyticus]QKS43875.1 EAL domain-containing protein [Paenibacillus cellulosilyticus]
MTNRIRGYLFRKNGLVYILLGLLSYACYSVPISPLFGISGSFTAGFLFLAVAWFGWRAGLVLLLLVYGALIGTQQLDFLLWSHLAEAIIIIVLSVRWPKLGLIGAGAVYWALIGIPMYVLLSSNSDSINQEMLFYTYIVTACGLFNVLLAELFVYYTPAGFFKMSGISVNPPLRISRALIHLMTAAMIGSSILFLMSGSNSYEHTIIKEINNSADQASHALVEGMKTMSPQEQRGIRLNGYMELATVRRMIDNALASDPYEAVLVGQGGRTLLHTMGGTSYDFEWLKLDNWQRYFAERRMWSPDTHELISIGSSWKNMSFIYPVPLGMFELYVRVPLDTYREQVYSVYNAQMMSCLYVAAIIGLFAFMIQRFIITGVRRLADVTNGIPDKVKEGIATSWPQSRLEEINSLVGNFRIVTEKLGHMFMESREQAYQDMLTGLPNRRNFNEHLEKAMDEMGPDDEIHVIFIDLDRFKYINDTLGHAVGDLLLQQVSFQLLRTVGDRAFIARLGGDEFVIVSNQQRNEVRMMAEELIRKLKRPFMINEEELFVTASMGISSSTISGDDIETIVKNADFAMYEAKAAGGNGYRFYEKPDNDLTQQMRLEFELHKALDRNQLQLHYMPIYNKEQEKLVSIEALLRWQHPEFGFVSPAQFIPIAESCGLLKPIGEWVAREACRQIKEWLDQGERPAPVAINLSPTQIQMHGIVGYLERLLEETGTPAELFEVEITEEVFAKYPERVITELLRLKQHGVKVWIDDFGTGYSSLGLLNRMPIDGFKIDRSFVKGLHEDSGKRSIIETMMLLSRSRNWHVVAEGVETVEESEALGQFGCWLQQGFYYGKAVPAAQIVSWFEQKREDERREAQ